MRYKYFIRQLKFVQHIEEQFNKRHIIELPPGGYIEIKARLTKKDVEAIQRMWHIAFERGLLNGQAKAHTPTVTISNVEVTE